MFGRILVLVACVIAGALAAAILIFGAAVSALTAIGWLFVVLALYFGSRLDP